MTVLNRIFSKSPNSSPPSLPITSEQRQDPGAREQLRRDKQLLAHDAMMMGDADELLQTQRDADRKGRELPPESTGVSRSIQIGDNTHYHYQQTSGRQGAGPIGKAVLAAALAGATGGVGLGLWNLLGGLGDKEVIDNTIDTDVDVKSRYVPPPEGPEQ